MFFGCIYRNSQELFDENVFNFTIIFPRPIIKSHQNNVNSISSVNNNNNNNTQILVTLCIGNPRSLGTFYLDYTNKNDINPLSVNYAISGKQLVKIGDVGIATLLNGLQYYPMNSSNSSNLSNNCCYMTSYFIEHYSTNPLDFYLELYLVIVDGNGNKLFKNDTLILIIDHTFASTNVTLSSEIHQLNVNLSDNDNVFYFAIVITTEKNIYVHTLYIDMTKKMLVSMDTTRLININDLPNFSNDYNYNNFVSVFVDSDLKYNDNEMFFVYQAYIWEQFENGTTPLFVFVQSYNYSAN